MNRVFGKMMDNQYQKTAPILLDKENVVNQSVMPKSKSMRRRNPQSVLDHQDDIQKYLISIDKPVMDPLISDVERLFMIKSLLNAQRDLMLLNQTCFMAIELFDRSPEKKRKMLEVYVFTCLHIACKFEEIYPPNLNTIACYSKVDPQLIIDTEQKILTYLDFKIISNNTLVFVEFISQKVIQDSSNPAFKRLLYYLTELTLLRKEMQLFNRARLATAIVMVAEQMFTPVRANLNWGSWKKIPNNDPAIKVMSAILSDKSRIQFIRDRYQI